MRANLPVTYPRDWFSNFTLKFLRDAVTPYQEAKRGDPVALYATIRLDERRTDISIPTLLVRSDDEEYYPAQIIKGPQGHRERFAVASLAMQEDPTLLDMLAEAQFPSSFRKATYEVAIMPDAVVANCLKARLVSSQDILQGYPAAQEYLAKTMLTFLRKPTTSHEAIALQASLTPLAKLARHVGSMPYATHDRDFEILPPILPGS